jgi:glycosyltransferase involved in cell wall biosynthesis
MNIAVNTRFLLKDKLEGIGWFTYETMKRITRKHKKHTFFFLFDRPWDQEFIFSENVVPVQLFPPARHPFLWYLWFEFSVNLFLKRNEMDFFISTDGYIPLKSKTPTLNVIHDINFEHRPYDLPWLTRWYYRFFFPRFAEKADRLATVSEYSKKDLVNTYGIRHEKVDVVYNGINTLYGPVTNDVKFSVKEQYADGQEFFIFVGALHPRKNIPGLLKAYDLFRKESASNHKLVIVGEKMFRNRELQATYDGMSYKEEVIFTGRLNPEDLHALLASATAMVFVPFFEGFGIPVIEAYSCRIPVIASNVTSVPEVAGEAALYADPEDINGIKNQMVKITTDHSLRKRLIENIDKQLNKFSWDSTADLLWSSCERLRIAYEKS